MEKKFEPHRTAAGRADCPTGRARAPRRHDDLEDAAPEEVQAPSRLRREESTEPDERGE